MLLQRCCKTVYLVYKIVKYIDKFKDGINTLMQKIHRVLFTVLVYICVKLFSGCFSKSEKLKNIYLLKGWP